MTIAEAAQVTAVIGAVFGAIRWLLGFYFRKSKELESYKSQESMRSIDQIKKEVEVSKSMMMKFEDNVGNFKNQIDDLKFKIKEHGLLLRDVSRTMEATEKQWEKSLGSLERKYQLMETSELVHVSGDTYILKARKA